MYDAAAEVLSLRRLTEFVDPPTTLRLQSSQEERQRTAILIVNKLGDWGRYGLQPLKVAHQQEGDTVSSLTYSTLTGGHFDGQIDIQIERTKYNTLFIQVRLAVPKKGRKVRLMHREMCLIIAIRLPYKVVRIQFKMRRILAQREGRNYCGEFLGRLD